MSNFVKEWEELDNSHVNITPNHIYALFAAMHERECVSNFEDTHIYNYVGSKTKYTRNTMRTIFDDLHDRFYSMIKTTVDKDGNHSDVFIYSLYSKFPTYHSLYGGSTINNSSIAEDCKTIKELIKQCYPNYKSYHYDYKSCLVRSKKGWESDLVEWDISINENFPDVILNRYTKRSPPNNYYEPYRYYYYDAIRGNTGDEIIPYSIGRCYAYLNNIYILWKWRMQGKLQVYVDGFTRKYVHYGYFEDWREESTDFFDFGTGLKLGWNDIGTFNFGDVVELASYGIHPHEDENGNYVEGTEQINISDGSCSITFPGMKQRDVNYECGFDVTDFKIDFSESLTYK